MTAPVKPTYEQLAAALKDTRARLFAAEKVIRNQRAELARLAKERETQNPRLIRRRGLICATPAF